MTRSRQIHPHRHHDQRHRRHSTAERIAEIADLGFESFEPFFWQTTNGQDLAELGKRCLDAIGNRDITISTIGMFGNPLEDQEMDSPDAAGLEGLHRQRPPFRRDLRRRLYRPHPRQAADRQPAALQGGLVRTRQARRRQGRQDRLRELRHGRQLGRPATGTSPTIPMPGS